MKIDVTADFISPLLEFSTKSMYFRVDKVFYLYFIESINHSVCTLSLKPFLACLHARTSFNFLHGCTVYGKELIIQRLSKLVLISESMALIMVSHSLQQPIPALFLGKPINMHKAFKALKVLYALIFAVKYQTEIRKFTMIVFYIFSISQ